MSTHKPLAERVLERAIENGLTPEADLFLEVRNRLLFGEGEARDLSKANDPELYGKREAFNRLMLQLFDDGIPGEGMMPLQPQRISRRGRARRWHKRVDQVPKTQKLVVGARPQDQALMFALLREFSGAVEGIIDPDDILVNTHQSVPKGASIQDFEENAILKRLTEDLEKALKEGSSYSRSPSGNPVSVLHVRQEDEDRKVYWGGIPFSLKERIFARVKLFWEQNDTARATWEKLHLTLHWGDEEERIEVEFPRESSV